MSSPQDSASVDIFSSDPAGIDLPSPRRDDSSFANDFYNSGRNNNYYADLDDMEDFDFHQADCTHVDRIHQPDLQEMAFVQPPEVINIKDDDDSDGFQEVRPKRKKTHPRKKSGSLCNFLSPHAYNGDSNSSSGTS